MKKSLLFLLSLILVFSSSACGQDSESVNNSKLKIGLVIAISGVDDKSFNQSTWEGIEKYAKENNLPSENYSYTNSRKDDDFIINLSDFADSNADLIIGPGYYFNEPITIVSNKYPNSKFLILDAVIDGEKNSGNVMSITFAEHEGSFLVGVVTALKAEELGLDSVAFIGGKDVPIVQHFEAGYIAGIKAINPEIDVNVEYADDFSNPIKGQELAQKLYNNGEKIIFNVAGSTGNGIIKEAVSRNQNGEEVWVIGVDKDQYEEGIYKDDKSCVLTSMVKHLDIATYNTLQAVEDGNFKGEHIIYSLKDQGVGLPKQNPNLKDEWLTTAKEFEQKIINKEIVVPELPDRLSN